MKPDHNMPIEKAKYLVAVALYNYVRHSHEIAEYNEVEVTAEENDCHRMDIHIAWDKLESICMRMMTLH